jgi:hypothetical protein
MLLIEVIALGKNGKIRRVNRGTLNTFLSQIINLNLVLEYMLR